MPVTLLVATGDDDAVFHVRRCVGRSGPDVHVLSGHDARFLLVRWRRGAPTSRRSSTRTVTSTSAISLSWTGPPRPRSPASLTVHGTIPSGRTVDIARWQADVGAPARRLRFLTCPGRPRRRPSRGAGLPRTRTGRRAGSGHLHGLAEAHPKPVCGPRCTGSGPTRTIAAITCEGDPPLSGICFAPSYVSSAVLHSPEVCGSPS